MKSPAAQSTPSRKKRKERKKKLGQTSIKLYILCIYFVKKQHQPPPTYTTLICKCARAFCGLINVFNGRIIMRRGYKHTQKSSKNIVYIQITCCYTGVWKDCILQKPEWNEERESFDIKKRNSIVVVSSSKAPKIRRFFFLFLLFVFIYSVGQKIIIVKSIFSLL